MGKESRKRGRKEMEGSLRKLDACLGILVYLEGKEMMLKCF